MNRPLSNYPKSFSTRKVSINRAMNVLKQHGAHVDYHQTEMILDFLYVIAKTYQLEDNKSSTNT